MKSPGNIYKQDVDINLFLLFFHYSAEHLPLKTENYRVNVYVESVYWYRMQTKTIVYFGRQSRSYLAQPTTALKK